MRADRFGGKDAIALAKMSSVLVRHSRAKARSLHLSEFCSPACKSYER